MPARVRAAAIGLCTGVVTFAQVPLLQDGAAALRQAQLAWALGDTPLPPSSLPFLEVGVGGADSGGAYVPLLDGEGLGHGSRGWGVGLQGRITRGGLSLQATALLLRDHGYTEGVLQRVALAYQTESGWRVALEQTPFAWGAGLNGGELMGTAARPIPRFSAATPDLVWPLGRVQAETFLGRLEGHRPIPPWLGEPDARHTAVAAGLDLQRPLLWGGLLRTSFGSLVEANLGAVALSGGRSDAGQAAPGATARTEALAELRVRLPALADLVQARGAALHLSRSGAPDSDALSLLPARNLVGARVVWELWDVGLEYAGAAPTAMHRPFDQPAYLAGFSSRGDALGPGWGREAITRTVEVGLPLFLDGQGRLKVLRITAPEDHPLGAASWCFQGEAQWRTPTGRLGASVASRHIEAPGAPPRWGWSVSAFQAFRVF